MEYSLSGITKHVMKYSMERAMGHSACHTVAASIPPTLLPDSIRFDSIRVHWIGLDWIRFDSSGLDSIRWLY